MKRLFLSILLAMPMMVMAGNVKSPNGNIELKFSLDDNGRPVYEIEFRVNGMEYEFDIDATSGAILDFDADLDD